MKIYYFGGTIDMVDMLHENGFDGNLFLAGSQHPDDFVKIAKFMDINKDFKYMVAIRAYAISPQYLSMICASIDQIAPGKIQINLISGHTKEDEKGVGGIVGPINDLSSKIEKSKYMIEFLETMHDMNLKKPDIDLQNSIVSFGPILKENGEYPDIDISKSPEDSGFYTKESLKLFLDNLKKSGVYGVLIYAWPWETEDKKIISFISDYTK